MKKFLMTMVFFGWLVGGCGKTNQNSVRPNDLQPQAVRESMTRVADWQLANPSKHPLTHWAQGALYAGMMSWGQMAEDPKYSNAVLDWGGKNNWQPGTRQYHADDHVVGQTYLEMYGLYKDPKMMQGVQERFDWILANSSDVTLKYGQQQGKDRWWWCDALFMAPPVWAKLSALTGESKYLDFMNKEWWATTQYLYDTKECLYFRDDRYFDKREANGKKIFWSRGNGWVMGGLVRVLESMPSDYPDRGKYIKLYRDMAAKLIAIQSPDGFWHASLLDPGSYPAPESSGTGFFCYSLAWGINHGILDEKTYLPAVMKSWNGLVGNIGADGKLGYVQQIGGDPQKTAAEETEAYGVGAFLLAGTEVYKIAIRNGEAATVVHLTNSAVMFREAETISLKWNELVNKNKSLSADKVAVFDFTKNTFLVSQCVDNDGDGKPDELLFQSDLAPGQQKGFWVMTLPQGVSRPETKDCVYGRHVPERYGDFGWESDRIAYRMYGKELEWETISPGIDVWVKKVRYPIVDTLYKNKKTYHLDKGEALDCYKVGPTLGCGGLGILAGDKLILSKNFRSWKVLANGPIRLIFELGYEPWAAGSAKVSEIKRISIDKGSNLNRIESRMTCEGQTTLALAAGIVVRGGKEEKKMNPDEKWISYWFAPDDKNGMTGCGVVLTGDTKAQFEERNEHLLAVVNQPCGKPFVYYAGAGWDGGPDFKTAQDWQTYLSGFAKRLANPVKVTLEK